MNENQDLYDILKKQRKYASYHVWPHQKTEELGVLQNLFESMQASGNCPYHKARISEEEPFDCVAEDKNGNLVGFQLTELVDQHAVILNEQGKEVYREWWNQELIERIEQIMATKDRKAYHRSSYAKLILVIYTGESAMMEADFFSVLEKHIFPKTTQINEVYLLFDYDPNPTISRCPFIHLKIAD